MAVEAVSLPSIETFLLPRKGISASFLEGILIASFEEAAMQDNVDFLQEPPPPVFFASRPITKLKSQSRSLEVRYKVIPKRGGVLQTKNTT